MTLGTFGLVMTLGMILSAVGRAAILWLTAKILRVKEVTPKRITGSDGDYLGSQSGHSPRIVRGPRRRHCSLTRPIQKPER